MMACACSLRPRLSSVSCALAARFAANAGTALPTPRSFASRRQASWDEEELERGERQRTARNHDAPPHWGRSTTQRSWSAPPRKNEHQPRRPRMPRTIEHPPPTAADLERYREMRVRRAERLERKDLTAQLTETKTYMGGFTQPRHLQYLTTLDPTRKEKDSHDIRVGPNRVRPAAEAYEPHTVYLAVTRYPVRWGHGRATRRECFSGFCRESELEDRFTALNYGTWTEEKTDLVKLRYGRPKEPVTTPAHWACHAESKGLLDLAVFPGSPEDRSFRNRSAGKIVSSLVKESARIKRDNPGIEDGDSFADKTSDKGRTLAEIDTLLDEKRATLLPPVQDFVRPSPPYTSPPLIVPLLTVTLPSRPLAATLARLCNSHGRGLPFIASIPDADRKDGPAVFRRLLRMRANRIQQLTTELVRKLEGYGGGLMGVRMNPEDRGRGIEGEGLGESVQAPARGWAEVSWLEDGSPCWEGIAQEEYVGSWDTVEGVKIGPQRGDNARWIEPHPLLSAGQVAGEANAPIASAQATPSDKAASRRAMDEVAQAVGEQDEALSPEDAVKQRVEEKPVVAA